jgi:TPR repeat protein
VDRADGSDPEDADAQWLLGARYLEGDGVVADAVQAVRWLRRAAEQGHPRGQNTLGHCYSTGKGVAKDPAAAVEWFRRAAEQGHARAQYNLAWCYESGHGVVADPARAVEWAQRAAEQGNVDAAFLVGSAYHFGRGIAKDLRQALYWMERAQAQVPMARRQVRILRWELHPLLRYSHRAQWVAGLALLAYHAVTVPFSIRWQAVALYVGIVAAASVGAIVVSSLLGLQLDKEPEEHGLLIRRVRRVIGLGAQIASEDGLFLVPVLHAGISVPSAIIAGTAFGLAHYPWFSPPACVPKGLAYIAVALFVLPSGIWSALAGHIIVDALSFGGEALFRRRSRSGGQ